MRIQWFYGFKCFFQIHLCYSSAKKEKTAIERSVLLVIVIISTIFNGVFLNLVCCQWKKKNDLTEENSLILVLYFFTVLHFKQYKSFLVSLII